jgi:hypothetical protein
MFRQPGIGRSAGSKVVMAEAADPLRARIVGTHPRPSIGSQNRLIEYANGPPPRLEQNCSRERIQITASRECRAAAVGDRRRA